MGVGNLQRALKAYGDERHPLRPAVLRLHAAAPRRGLEGPRGARRRLLHLPVADRRGQGHHEALPRRTRRQLARPRTRCRTGPSAEHVLRPPQSHPGLRRRRRAAAATTLVARRRPGAAAVARAGRRRRAGERALRDPPRSLLRYLALGVREAIAQDRAADRDRRPRAASRPRSAARVGAGVEAAPVDAHDRLRLRRRRAYRSPAQAQALQFWLDRLTALNLIAWVREPTVIHVTVGPLAQGGA